MDRRSRLILLVAAALLFSPLGSDAAEKGWFGFALAIDADGILNPKLRSIKIDKIFPASPAAKAGLSAGDMIVEIDGIAVEGAKADTLKAAMQKSVGETLRLKIKRGADAFQDVSLIAGPKPGD
ncbi:MAG TPA: PDZ domain-containing protein [Steroidobacteraceae bacterium]|nr:PDZ domain-containing protein [Steroidobacteraceae bacterium]